jgi:UDP-N-acetylglucosamine acyltransferase
MAQASIDPRAAVDPTATLGEEVHVGPFCVVGAGASIGARTRLESHVVVDGSVTLGPDNVVAPFASLGGPPQDLKYTGEPTKVVIGAGNQIKEYVTINRGTVGGGGVTRIGDGCLIMAYVHIAHDCQVGSRIIFANGATLAGHVEVGDDATVGLFCGVHQFTRIAKHAFIGGYSPVSQDALPWIITVGNRDAKSHGINSIGLKRKGYPQETIDAIKSCYRTLFRSKMLLPDAIAKVEAELGHVPEVRYFLDFVQSSKRGVIR